MNEYVIAYKSDLVAIADAIRTKTGSTEGLKLPAGFVEAVDEITAEKIEYETVHITAPEVKSTFVRKYENDSVPESVALTIDGSNDWSYRALLQHDFSSIPSEAEVLSATLKIFVLSGNDNYKSSECYVGSVLDSWEEDSSLIWSNQPSHQSYSSGSSETPKIGPNIEEQTWISIDITSIVKKWHDGDIPNYGIVIRAITEGEYRRNWVISNRKYYSRDCATRVEVSYKTPIKNGIIPDGSDVTFGYETKGVSPSVIANKALYNGVLLPKISEDIIKEYPYAWIREDISNTGFFNLVVCKTPWYLGSNSGHASIVNGPNGVAKHYKLAMSDAPDATEWPWSSDLTDTYFWVSGGGKTILWSNHDIPNGSADSTDIYFEGSEPVEVDEDMFSTPAEREEEYSITSADLNELGAAVQNVCDVGNLLTVSEMAAHIKGIQSGSGSDSSSGGGAAPACEIMVVAPIGSTVVCTNTGTGDIQGSETDGVWSFKLAETVNGVDALGRKYTVTATKGDWNKSALVTVTGKSLCVVELLDVDAILENNTWEEIISASENDLIPYAWLGQSKEMTLTTGETVYMQVADFHHDDLTDGTGKAGITFISEYLLATYYTMKPGSDPGNSGGWNGSYSRRNWCNSTLFTSIPENVRTSIKAVNKISDSGGTSPQLVTTSDLCWFPSADETVPNAKSNCTYLTGQGYAYPIFGRGNSHQKSKIGDTAYHWWTRSTDYRDEYKWVYVTSWNTSHSYDASSASFGVAFGFCV